MWKNIFKIFGILYLPLLILSIVLFVSQKKEHIEYLSKLQERETSIKKEFFINLFHTPIHNGNYWSKLVYPENFDPLNTHAKFMEPYIKIITGITDYDQFRFLDLNGMEIFRAERKGIDSLEFGGLQDKQNRRYFKEGSKLNYGQLYLSQINLNRENGEIEIPYKPVIRVVAPIFDVNKKKIGVVVINFKMDHILDRLKSNIVDNNFYLLNDSLNIITSNIYKEHIPFEVSKSIAPLNETYGLSEDLFKKDTSILRDGHIWSIQPINLNESIVKSPFGSGSPIEIVTTSNWSVVQELPPRFLKGSLTLLYFGFGIFNILAILLLLTLAYFLVKSRLQKETYLNELEAKNIRLSKKRKLLEKNNSKISEINHQLGIRNKQLSEFNYLVSHNLKAPVTSMSVIVDMIKKEKEPGKINELLPKLSQIAESITELTKDIGDYVSILDEKKVKVEDVHIGLLINHIKNDFSETLLNTKDFQVIVDLEAWQHITFSTFYLHSILHNLISNSIKYRRSGVSSFIKFTTAFESDKKVLYITDNGLGINLEKHRDNIFKLYKRFHKNTSGKGIGLFLVKSQLETLGATITLDSEENSGTTFKIVF